MDLKLAEVPEGLNGLVFITSDNRVLPMPPHHQWLVTALPDGTIQINRYFRGRFDEGWAPIPPWEAAMAMTAIVNGYQRPRRPDRLDKLFDEIGPESG